MKLTKQKALDYLSFKDDKFPDGKIIHIEKDKFGKGVDETWIIERGCYGDYPKLYAYNKLNSCREIYINSDDNKLYFDIDKPILIT